MSGPEKTFENKVREYIIELKGWALKYWGGSKYTKSGIPDLLCGINGFFVAIEVKSTVGRPKPIQLFQIRKMREAGIIAFILYPDQFEEFKTLCDFLLDNNYLNALDYINVFDKKLTKKELILKNPTNQTIYHFKRIK